MNIGPRLHARHRPNC